MGGAGRATQADMEWTDYNEDTARGAVRDWIAEAISDADTAAGMEDDRLDLIIEAARRRDIDPRLVRLWIFDQPAHAWTAGHLIEWACRRGFVPTQPEDIERAFVAAKKFGRALRSL